MTLFLENDALLFHHQTIVGKISFSIQLDQENTLTHFHFLLNEQIINKADDQFEIFKECHFFLNALQGKNIDSFSSVLQSLTLPFYDNALMLLLKNVFEMRGVLILSEKTSSGLICSCFGVNEEKIKAVIDSSNVNDPISIRKLLSEKLSVSNACGRCFQAVNDMIPNMNECRKISSNKGFLSPISFHQMVREVIEENLNQENIRWNFVRGSGQKIYFKIEIIGQSLLNPLVLKEKMELIILSETGVDSEVSLSFI